MRHLILLLSLALTFQASALSSKLNLAEVNSTGYIKVVVEPEHGKTDILFVIDNSGSMEPHQQNLARNMEQLGQTLTSTPGLDAHIAVLTTDMDKNPWQPNHPGQFRAMLTSQTPDLIRALGNAVMVGVSGSAAEQPLGALKASLSSPLLEGPNAGFLRPDAHLTVVFVTDADDQANPPISGQAMVDFMKNLKGEAGYSIYAFTVTQPSDTCHPDDSSNPTTYLKDFISLSGGTTFNICDPNWQPPMQTILNETLKIATRTIQLPTAPIISTIEVRFGTRTLVGGDLEAGWFYDATNTTIVLGPKADLTGQPPNTPLEIKFVPKYWK